MSSMASPMMRSAGKQAGRPAFSTHIRPVRTCSVTVKATGRPDAPAEVEQSRRSLLLSAVAAAAAPALFQAPAKADDGECGHWDADPRGADPLLTVICARSAEYSTLLG